MRTIFVLFDSLNRLALGAYGGTAIATPNFDRFAQRAKTFTQHYAGSLPCIPARRDMHTGRLNFTHRSWGPLEPFDNSFADILSKKGVYTHLVSDHAHYFENGGWGYANAFDSWNFIRGQEGDPMHVMTAPPVQRLQERYNPRHYPFGDMGSDGGNVTEGNSSRKELRRLRHAVNRTVMQDEQDYPTAKCFSSAFDFLNVNRDNDDWFLQLECFDPHEPFTAPERFRDSYASGYEGGILDWPLYEKVTDSEQEIREIRGNYAALVAMCDEYFGRLLDWMDEEDAWSNTALVLSTDHGFLLGEHEWWAKNRMPYYEEISHIPLMIWHPEQKGLAGECDGLSQTADLMPTFLDFHGIKPPPEVTAHSLKPLLSNGSNERESAILGMFAGPICIVDGRFSYFHFPVDVHAQLPAYTIMPSHMVTMFEPGELESASLSEPFDFSKGMPLLRVPTVAQVNEGGYDLVRHWTDGSILFDLSADPGQESPIDDPQVISRMQAGICWHLDRQHAPPECYAHYGLKTPQERSESAEPLTA